MLYWDCVLKEVLNKKTPSKYFCYTNLDEVMEGAPTYPVEPSEKPLRIYLVDKRYAEIYFTRRESECLVLLTTGQTIKETAATLKLSPRTVEFYLKNIKEKLQCRTKIELLEKIQDSDFLQRAEEHAISSEIIMEKA